MKDGGRALRVAVVSICDRSIGAANEACARAIGLEYDPAVHTFLQRRAQSGRTAGGAPGD